MTARIVIRRAAAADIGEARAWYHDQDERLARELLDEIEATIGRIANGPERYPIAHGDARRALVRRFPFAIYFRLRHHEVRVIAVIHQNRDPRVWQRRVRG